MKSKINHNFSKLYDYRNERKYILFSGEFWKFKEYLIEKDFKVSFPSRWVNSIYFDTKNFDFFNDNIQGISKRTKVRIRWYNENFNLNLELKKKNNMSVWKPTLNLGKFNSLEDIKNYFSDKKNLSKIFNYTGAIVFPVLIIKYKREYWTSFCNNFRATVDNFIEVSKFNSNRYFNKGLSIDSSILEFKYSIKKDSNFRNEILNKKFPFRNNKFSKYIMSSLALKASGIL